MRQVSRSRRRPRRHRSAEAAHLRRAASPAARWQGPCPPLLRLRRSCPTPRPGRRIPPPPAQMTTTPLVTSRRMTGSSSTSIGSGDGTTRRQFDPLGRNVHPSASWSPRARVSSTYAPIGFVGFANAGSAGSTRTSVSKRRNLDAAQISSSRWSRHPIIASVCAVTTSSGERSSGANDVSLAASIPTCGPFPWVTTRRVRSAARPRTFAVSRIRCRWLSALWGPERGANALPPSPTTTVFKPIDGHPGFQPYRTAGDRELGPYRRPRRCR